ncbi:MAG: pyridoxal-phosphate dependent enzyme [Deltaproteobacteria bacterium]|nr:pyridoxal-phosphate dependent enzyme [Deltaproteobacteria bacterium]
MSEPGMEEFREAHEKQKPYLHRTPVLTCGTLNQLCGAEIFFKCENFQKTGAFKIRGALNAVLNLSDEQAARGVTTHSSGNHAAALALAAGWRGIRAYVVMPGNAPEVKKAAVAGYGAEIIFCEPTLEAREEATAEVMERTGAAFIHPYNNLDMITGHGTAALELCEEAPGLDAIMAPVGGGGLISGIALAVAEFSPQTEILAAEPEKADDAYRSLQAGRIIPSKNPETIADGLLTSLGDLTFPIIQKHVSRILTVSEEAIVEAMRLTWERMKIIIEPSAAVPLAALLDKGHGLEGSRVGIILSGGNLDLGNLPWNA